MTLVESFERAWLAVQGNEFSHTMARRSLEASVDGVEELETALRSLKRRSAEYLVRTESCRRAARRNGKEFG